MHQLNIRLSYHDMKMFQKILESLPHQKEATDKTRRKKSKDQQQPANVQGLYNSYLFLLNVQSKALYKCEYSVVVVHKNF